MKYYTFKELAAEDQFNYDTEFEAIDSEFDHWVWMDCSQWKDCIGQPIYEGDILELKNNIQETIRVVCHFGSFTRDSVHGNVVETYGFYFQDGKRCSHPITKNYAGVHDCQIMKIIGNIYEHPHLIK